MTDNESDSHDGILGERTELAFAIGSGLLLLTGWLLSWGHVAYRVEHSCYVLACLLGGFFTLREGISNLLKMRFEIDLLMLVAAVGAITLGKWLEAGLLLFLFSLGHALEHFAMGCARQAIEALGKLTPQSATVRRNSVQLTIPVEEIHVGDIVIVKPHERLPADGFVVKGESSVDQSAITGESVPVDKKPVADAKQAAAAYPRLDQQYRVFAGTINQNQALEVQAARLPNDTSLARVIKLVAEAEAQKSPTQLLTDKFERWFVPIVLGFTILLLFAGLVIDEPFSQSFYRAMAVLVAASPCALAISTPSAVLSGIACAARNGVLIKGGGPLETLGKIDAIAFDKTGTLTEGKPRLADIVPSDTSEERELLQVALSVERLSDHPLASAISNEAKKRLNDAAVPESTDLKSITGRGVQATIEGERVYIGKDDLFKEIEGPSLPDQLQQRVNELESNGRTTMIVRKGNRYLGVLGLMDTPREAAKGTIASLRHLGITRMMMLSGDNQHVADAVAKEIGLDEARGDLMPTDKVDFIKQLRDKGIAMVGDGVNDAPAMAHASVGIAMGAAGSDVALETADVALMADDLNRLPFAVGLSRRSRQIIQQNLWMSLGMVFLLIPATVFGLQIGPAVALHEGSTLLVVANSLRLLAYQGQQ